ncbi:DUF4365 domain-containing protein [Pseudoflavitalea rhizosphaerae]|uniref:DUF4365 domain-containing protein n=1 Tax=Pseudoflavitalea rhizosphaerae TaxID=1884793 RepID=UPI000F8D842A|nr:DUF4365 domain-containing protein [Pseudoflavitalea rhizosphaerae]
MAIFDKPQIDQSSINSTESENALLAILSEKNGFITRKEIPDKGCDFMCELIEDKGATGQKFPIQLKSITNIKLVDNEKYISYPILTSRIGYIIGHLPTTGIIVFFDVQTGLLYYDTVDAIYDRIMSEKKSDDWTNNGHVSIKIPIDSRLTRETASELHQNFLNRFNQATKMQIANGKKYNLPTINLSQEFQFDFNNIEHLKLLLKQHGFELLGNYDLDIIHKTIAKLTNDEINSDKGILILAAITFCEIGKQLESDLAIRRLKYQFDLTDEESVMIEHVGYKNQVLLGLIDQNTFREKLLLLKEKSKGDNITIDINILKYTLMDISTGSQFEEAKITLKRIFSSINESSNSVIRKYLYTVWNAENESMLSLHELSNNLALIKVKASLERNMSPDQQREFLNSFLTDELRFLNRLNEIYQKAVELDNKHIQAVSLTALTTHCVQRAIINLTQGPVNIIFIESQFTRVADVAYKAYKLYIDLGLLADAHFCITNAIEILDANKFIFKSDVDANADFFISIKNELEKRLMIPSSRLVIREIIEERKKMENEKDIFPPMYSLKDRTDKELELYAGMMLQSLDVPSERMANIMEELKAIRQFYNRCNDFSFVILLNKHNDYKLPVRFILRNVKTLKDTHDSADMDELLKAIGLKDFLKECETLQVGAASSEFKLPYSGAKALLITYQIN